MIKRIEFVARRSGLTDDGFAAGWAETLALAANAPTHLRPKRAVACLTLHNVASPDVPHDGIRMDWFTDLNSLQRFETWLRARPPARALDLDTCAVVVAEEVVMRGVDWLAARWTGGVKLKHMALARRATGLSPAEFSERWRAKQGTVWRRGAPATPIPDNAKGFAYVQNHPIARPVEWVYDAINEVYFDDLDGMRARIDFFRNYHAEHAEAPLVRHSRYVAVAEHVIDDAHHASGPGLANAFTTSLAHVRLCSHGTHT